MTITLLCLISPSMWEDVSSNIQCNNYVVKMKSSREPFKPCFNDDCHIPVDIEKSLSVALPISQSNDKLAYSYIAYYSTTASSNSRYVIVLKSVITNSLCRTVLRNPQRQPAGAIAIAALSYYVAMISTLFLCAISRLEGKISRSTILNSKTNTPNKYNSNYLCNNLPSKF